MVNDYDVDGLRIDTCLHVPKTFWSDYTNSAGVYTVCEINNGNPDKVAPYTYESSAALNYPLFWVIRNALLYGSNMWTFQDHVDVLGKYRDYKVMGNFIDNHDWARFLSIDSNWNKFKTAQVAMTFWPGIPIGYYGDEQAFSGGNDPYNREYLWNSMDTSSEMYQFVKTMNQVHKDHRVAS